MLPIVGSVVSSSGPTSGLGKLRDWLMLGPAVCSEVSPPGMLKSGRPPGMLRGRGSGAVSVVPAPKGTDGAWPMPAFMRSGPVIPVLAEALLGLRGVSLVCDIFDLC